MYIKIHDWNKFITDLIKYKSIKAKENYQKNLIIHHY